MRMIKKHTGVKTYAVKNIMYMGLLCLPCALLCHFCYTLLQHIFPVFVNIPLSGGIGVIAFVILCHVFKLINITSYAVEIKQKLKSKKKKASL